MDGTRHSRVKETLKEQNFRSGYFKGDEAHTRSAQAEGSRAWIASRPSALVVPPCNLNLILGTRSGGRPAAILVTAIAGGRLAVQALQAAHQHGWNDRAEAEAETLTRN